MNLISRHYEWVVEVVAAIATEGVVEEIQNVVVF